MSGHDCSTIAQELAEIDRVRARLTDVIDAGSVPFPDSHYITNALDALYSSRLWLLKTYTPTQGDAA